MLLPEWTASLTWRWISAPELPEWSINDRVTAGLDAALSEAGYDWSRDSAGEEGGRSQRWYISVPRNGTDGSGFQAVVFHFGDGPRTAAGCDVEVDLLGTQRIRAQAAWRSFFLLRDGILPEAMPGARVHNIEHPGLSGRAWDVRGLAARFAPGEALPRQVRERVEAHEGRLAFVQWIERAAWAASTTWKSWMAEPPWEEPGDALYGPSQYFLFPKSWIAFAAFAVVVVAGVRFWSRPGRWWTVGFVALVIVLLMPVKVPTWAGWVYVPHGYVQVFDFDPRYYFREAPFVLVAALGTGVVGWLLRRLLCRVLPARHGG